MIVWRPKTRGSYSYHRVPECNVKATIQIELDKLHRRAVPCERCRPRSNPNYKPLEMSIGGEIVYLNERRCSGYKKYHASDCKQAEQRSLTRVCLDDANGEWTPCLRCRPPMYKDMKIIKEGNPEHEIIVYMKDQKDLFGQRYHTSQLCHGEEYPRSVRVFQLEPSNPKCTTCQPPDNPRFDELLIQTRKRNPEVVQQCEERRKAKRQKTSGYVPFPVHNNFNNRPTHVYSDKCRETKKIWNEMNPEKIAEYQQQYKLNNLEMLREKNRILMKQYREQQRRFPSNDPHHTAKHRHRSMANLRENADLVPKNVVYQLSFAPCWYCGVINEVCGVDRINNKIGYISGNVVPACMYCNIMKNAMDLEIFFECVNMISNIHKKKIISKGCKYCGYNETEKSPCGLCAFMKNDMDEETFLERCFSIANISERKDPIQFQHVEYIEPDDDLMYIAKTGVVRHLFKECYKGDLRLRQLNKKFELCETCDVRYFGLTHMPIRKHPHNQTQEFKTKCCSK